MRRLLILVVLALALPCLALGQATQKAMPGNPGTATQAQPAAPTRGPEVKKLEVWVGTWKVDGEFLMDPKGKFSGTVTCEWFPGEFSVVCRVDGTGARGPINSLSIISYSTLEKTYTLYSVGRTGADRAVNKMSVAGNTWTAEYESTLSGKPAKYRDTWVWTSPTSHSYKVERSIEGGPWTQTFNLTGTKPKTTP